MSIYDIEVETIKGEKTTLAEHKGKAMLVVNTASKCGFTKQYDGLEALYENMKDDGVVVLGFPCNQFGGQEPGNEDDIQEFCRLNHGVTFPLFSKVDVNGDDAHPLFKYLKSEKPGLAGSEKIKWNFTKFLVDGDGKVVKRYAPQDKPEKIAKDIAKGLKD